MYRVHHLSFGLVQTIVIIKASPPKIPGSFPLLLCLLHSLHFFPILLFFVQNISYFATFMPRVKSAQCLPTSEKKPLGGVVINQDLEKMVNTARLGFFISPRGWDDDGWCSLAFKVWLQLIAATFHPEYQPGHLNGPEMTEDKSRMC